MGLLYHATAASHNYRTTTTATDLSYRGQHQKQNTHTTRKASSNITISTLPREWQVQTTIKKRALPSYCAAVTSRSRMAYITLVGGHWQHNRADVSNPSLYRNPWVISSWSFLHADAHSVGHLVVNNSADPHVTILWPAVACGDVWNMGLNMQNRAGQSKKTKRAHIDMDHLVPFQSTEHGKY